MLQKCAIAVRKTCFIRLNHLWKIVSQSGYIEEVQLMKNNLLHHINAIKTQLEISIILIKFSLYYGA